MSGFVGVLGLAGAIVALALIFALFAFRSGKATQKAKEKERDLEVAVRVEKVQGSSPRSKSELAERLRNGGKL